MVWFIVINSTEHESFLGKVHTVCPILNKECTVVILSVNVMFVISKADTEII